MNLERGGATNLLEYLQSGMQAGEPGWQLRDPGVRRHADLGLPMPRPQLSSNLLYSPGATGRPYKDPYDYTPFNELGPPPSTGRTAPWETVGPQQPIMPMDATPGDWGPLKPIQTQPSTLLEAAQLNPEAVMPAETGGFWQGSGASMAGAGIGAGIGLIGGLIQGAAERKARKQRNRQIGNWERSAMGYVDRMERMLPSEQELLGDNRREDYLLSGQEKSRSRAELARSGMDAAGDVNRAWLAGGGSASSLGDMARRAMRGTSDGILDMEAQFTAADRVGRQQWGELTRNARLQRRQGLMDLLQKRMDVSGQAMSMRMGG